MKLFGDFLCGLRIARIVSWIAAALILGFVAVPNATAQISAGGSPPSFSFSISSAVPIVTMPPVDVSAYLAEDAQEPKDAPLRFGAVIDVLYNLENSGEWTMLPDGGRIWRLRIISHGAYSISLLYDQWYIPEGGELFIYNDDRSQVIGAFTSFNNWTDGTNITQPVAGDATILEYYEPSSILGQSVLSIYKVVHAYRNLFGHHSLDDYGDSGSCNNNVNCPVGEPWQDQKRGVAMILDGGFRLCTGSLVNNTNDDYTPYFLTANHCLGGETHWTFMFNYESPDCPNQNGPTNQTVSNATRRANNSASDFALLQLSSAVPLSYNPYFCGWSRIDQPATNSVCIHHPEGDIKKISFDDDPPISDTWSGTPANSHWRIAAWDDGTTEPGSSGSPLFDQNHRITGQLHGGQASCSFNFNDYFGKFAMSWNYGSSASTRLRDWLDPSGTDVMTLDGVDPNRSGRIGGMIADENALPLGGARIGVVGDEQETFSDSTGHYLLGVPDGTYDFEYTKFGYQRVVIENVEVVTGDTVWQDVTLNSAPEGVLHGTVTTQIGQGVQGAEVVIRNTPLDTLFTDSLGQFIVSLPSTDYDVYAAIHLNVTPPVIIERDTVLTIAAGDTTDAIIELFVQYIEPTDPDTHGYRAYDRYDRDIPADFEWVEIDPTFGYSGTEFEFPSQDSAVFLDTPFPITFYAEDSDTLTVNANGWMLPGIHADRGNNNYPIPYDAPVDPPGIIAPFWDDLRTGLGAQQFFWHDTVGGRWIFEFANQHLIAPANRIENWEVHFLDPAFYPTLTGDCEIQFVYGLMEYISTCTIGIEDPEENTGIQILYNGTYNPTSWPIEYGAAIRFTTGHPTETGSVSGTLLLHPSSGNITSAVIHLAGLEVSPNSAGEFSSTQVPACPVSAQVLLSGYELARANHVRVAADSTSTMQIEAWRLDPPRELDATQNEGFVTLRWRVPESVEAATNPNVRYLIYRNDEFITFTADTFFVDGPFADDEDISYHVVTKYRYGRSLPTDDLQVLIDLAADDVIQLLPTEFALEQNYPNPFNPSTIIHYDLPVTARVSLKIFDVNGREVVTLVDRTMPGGSYSATWNANGLPTGMYLAVMEAGDHRFVQKMLLLK